MKTIDDKISELIELNNEFLLIEYYSHTQCEMYKIRNVYTEFKEEKIVLCPISDGIEKALDIAISEINKSKIKYFKSYLK